MGGTLEQEENKVLRAQLELGQVKQEIDRRVAEKEEEFNNTRKNHARAMESMSASLEAEQKAKGEALRVKKALEGEINELEIGLDHAKAYQRAERKCKELAFTAGEDKKNQDRMTDLASKLQSKIKVYKQQIEEAEEIA